MEERRRKILSLVDPERHAGIEIGPLNKPVVARTASRILYADHLSTAELRDRYAPHAAKGALALDDIVEVDLVVAGGTPLAAALGQRGPVHYIVASHVIEHVPDTIGWLRDIADCLIEGGHLCLAVPDKRFTFDHFREPTRLSELVDAHLRRAIVPTAGQVYDSVANVADVDGSRVWRRRPVARTPIEGHGPPAALFFAREAAESGTYHDVHCSVFTPASFCDVIGQAMGLGLVPFEFASFTPTAFGESEFFATLRTRSAATPAERAATAPQPDRTLHHHDPASTDPRVLAGGLKRAWRRVQRRLTR